MTMKNNAKFEGELTCRFKINMRNFTDFDRSTPETGALMELIKHAKYEEKLAFGLENAGGIWKSSPQFSEASKLGI